MSSPGTTTKLVSAKLFYYFRTFFPPDSHTKSQKIRAYDVKPQSCAVVGSRCSRLAGTNTHIHTAARTVLRRQHQMALNDVKQRCWLGTHKPC